SLPILEIFKDEKHFPCAVYPAWEKYYSAESLTALKKYSETETIRIEKVNGQVVNNYAEYQEAQLAKMGQVMTCTINGTDMTIPAIPMRAIPVRFKMGAIAAVLPGSDAEKQGIKADDTIVAVDGDADIDPLKLPQTLLQKVNDGHKTVELTVKKIDGTGSTLTVALAPIRILPELSAASMRDPLGSNALGLAWNIEPTITAVDDSRFKSGLPVPAIGDQLTGVEFVNCEHVFIRNTSFCKNDKDGFFISGIGDRVDIPFIFAFLLQEAKPLNLDKDGQDKNTNEKILSVRLTLKSPDGTAKVVPLPVLEADNWFNADRGFVLKPDETIFKAAFNAAGLGEALSMGTDRMLYYSGLVYRSLDALINGRVSTRALSGPVGIVMILYDFAQSGWSRYLMLLCLIGANLAVINMLPIPPLDGGHVVFLTYEGIFRRPPNELIQVVLSYFGLFLIILLMVWTVTIDFGCIPRI
ncbi:MAG: site-2 protease family protein, partial [Planctomycetaceae bacterium]|nr:site-2 protease family protein [Planctomycetaceae bacterium]